MVQGKWVYLQHTIGAFPRLISVPTHFFKVILATKYTPNQGTDLQLKQEVVAAFLVPNSEIDSKVCMFALLSILIM
jgi:DNA/RNA endonuclease G (NUC1)